MDIFIDTSNSKSYSILNIKILYTFCNGTKFCKWYIITNNDICTLKKPSNIKLTLFLKVPEYIHEGLEVAGEAFVNMMTSVKQEKVGKQMIQVPTWTQYKLYITLTIIYSIMTVIKHASTTQPDITVQYNVYTRIICLQLVSF